MLPLPLKNVVFIIKKGNRISTEGDEGEQTAVKYCQERSANLLLPAAAAESHYVGFGSGFPMTAYLLSI